MQGDFLTLIVRLHGTDFTCLMCILRVKLDIEANESDMLSRAYPVSF